MSVQLCSGRVVRWPESFTVEGDVSSTVVLFLSIVQDWDTVCQEYEGDDVLGFGVVACVAVLPFMYKKHASFLGIEKVG